MDSKLFCDWYKNEFVPIVKKWRQAKSKTGKVLLLLDNAPSHPSAEVLNAFDSDFVVIYLPPNVTSLIQPMDQGVIEKLKRMYRKQILRRLLLAEDNTEDSVVLFSKALNLKHCSYMLADAWDSLTEKNLKNSWNKLWPPSVESEQETVEEIPRADLPEFVELFNSIPGFTDCNEKDAIDWINNDANDPGYQILDDDEIVSSLMIPGEENDNDDSSSDEDSGTCKKPSNAEAFAALETGLEWYEQQEESCPTQLLLLKRLRDLAATKRVTNIRQAKMLDFCMKKP